MRLILSCLIALLLLSTVGAVSLSTESSTIRYGCDDFGIVTFSFGARNTSSNVSLYLQNLTDIPVVESELYNSSNLTLAQRIRYFFMPNIEVDTPIELWTGNASSLTRNFVNVGDYSFYVNESDGVASNVIDIRIKEKTPLGIAKCSISYYLKLAFGFALSLFIIKAIIMSILLKNKETPPPSIGLFQ